MSESPLKQNKIVPIDKLVPHPRNYRQHPETQVSKLVSSLIRFGQGRSIVCQDGPQGYLIVAGHGIVEAAKKLNYTELRADILPANWSVEDVEGYLVADNMHSQEAEDDNEILVQLLQEQQDAGFDLASLGTDDETLRQMLESLGDEYVGDESENEGEDDFDEKRQSLAERFIVPPFSVLDARQGYWQERKKAWIALGIQSEVGRDKVLASLQSAVNIKNSGIKQIVEERALDKGSSIFDPVLCELAYSWFCPPNGTILDPFAGGSVRGIVAAKLGRQYVGIDLRAEQVEANEEQASRICTSGSPLMLSASDPSQDYTPDLTPVKEHGGYLVKRDDLFQIAGVRGGKVRTVWSLAQGAQGLVSSGSRHSPHVHRVAAIAQRLGIPCRVHVATGENTPDVQGAEDAGAEVIRHKAGYLNVLNARAREDAEQSGYTLIPFGVVCPEAVKQVSGQVDNLPQDIKRLVVPVGSGITLSGILQGLKRIGRTLPILGVCVGKDAIDVIDQYAHKNWRNTVELVQSSLKFEAHPKDTHLGELPLDPTYEAKCLPFLQPGDCLWSIGLRASAVEDEGKGIHLPMPQWITGDSRNISTLCSDVHADLIFTCPPYYDLEVYSDDPLDLSAVNTYEEFLTSYQSILKQAIERLKDNRFVCVVVGDIRDKNGFYRNFVSDTITACQNAGAKLYNEAILVTQVGSLPIRVGKQFTASRKLGKTHQNVLVFCKGDPVKAVEACGPVVVEIPDDEDELERVEEATHE